MFFCIFYSVLYDFKRSIRRLNTFWIFATSTTGSAIRCGSPQNAVNSVSLVAIKSNFKFSGERLNTSEVITAYKKLLLPEPELPTTSIFAATDKLHVSYSFFVFLPGTIIKSLPSCLGSFLNRRLLDFFSEFLSKKLLFYQSNSEQAFSLSRKAPT